MKKLATIIISVGLLSTLLFYNLSVVYAAANTHSAVFVRASSMSLSEADTAGLSVTSDMTLQCWFKPASTLSSDGQTMGLLTKYDSGSNNRSYIFEYERAASSNQLAFVGSSNGQGGTTVRVNSTVAASLTVGVWTHLAVVYTAAAGTADFYQDGAALGTQRSGLPTSIFNSTASFFLGSTDGGSPLDGNLDDCRVYSVARTSGEIAADYAQQITSFTNVAGYWQLNNDLLDASGNSHTLTNNNSVTFSTSVPFTGAGPSFAPWQFADF